MSLILALLPAAHAEESAYLVLLERAKAAILVKDWDGARKALDQAEAVAPANDVVILGRDLVRLDFYRGVVEWYAGDRDQAALDAWRRAAVFDNRAAPEADVLPEVEAQDAFYAVASEVRGYPEVDLALPDDPGGATIFVDGVPRESGDSVRSGNHYVQVRCEEGDLVGSWYAFGTPPPDYLVLCTGGSYPSAKRGRKPVKPDPKPKPDKPPEAGPVAVTGPADPAPVGTAPPVAPPPVGTAPVEPPPIEGGAVEGGPTAGGVPTDAPVEGGPKRRSAGPWVVAGVGGGVLALGAAAEVAMVERLYQQSLTLQDGSLTADEAEAFEQKYDRWRLISGSLLGTGLLTVTTGVIVGVVDAQLVVGPGRLGIVGRW